MIGIKGMSRFIRYTCNKKNIPVLKDECKKCSEYNPCAQDGEWCFVGALIVEKTADDPRAVNNLTINHTANAILNSRNDEKISLHLDNTRIDISRENFLKSIEQSVYDSFGVSKYIMNKEKA